MVDAVKPAKDTNKERMFGNKKLAESLCELTCVLREGLEQRKTEFDWLKLQQSKLATKCDLKELENNMAIKVSEVKAAVATLKQQNREAFTEIGTRIADLVKEIADLVAGVGDPSITDEAFEKDLRDLQADAKALADIVPGTPTTEPPPAPPV